MRVFVNVALVLVVITYSVYL